MNPIDAARERIREALTPHFRGKTADGRVDAAVSDVLISIEHLITHKDEVKKGPLGATVMTEAASAVKAPGITPRNL